MFCVEKYSTSCFLHFCTESGSLDFDLKSAQDKNDNKKKDEKPCEGLVLSLKYLVTLHYSCFFF